MQSKPEALKEVLKKTVYSFVDFLLELEMSCIVDFL